MLFTDHYSGSPVCAPSRSVFLTGQHTGYTPIRGNDEWTERGDTWNYQAMFDDPSLEGQRPIPDSTITIAEVLKTAGYATGMVGKWGLGAPNTSGLPNNQGFDFFMDTIVKDKLTHYIQCICGKMINVKYLTTKMLHPTLIYHQTPTPMIRKAMKILN